MEAGKQRLSRDTTRDATRLEINVLKRESADLKDLVAELSLDLHRLKKIGAESRRRPYQRMSVDEKAQVLQKVESSLGSKRKVLSELGVFQQERLLPLESQSKAGKP